MADESMVPAQPLPQALATNAALQLMRSANEGGKFTLSSFDVTTPAGSRMLVQATLLDCIPLKEMIGKQIAVVDFYCHDAGRESEGGEFDEWTRIVIFDRDGKAYSCGSRGVAKALAVIAMARQNVHFDPPVLCEVRLKQLGNAKQWLTLLPDLNSLALQTSKKAK